MPPLADPDVDDADRRASLAGERTLLTWWRTGQAGGDGGPMSQAIGQVLSLGVGVSLSPIPIVGVVLMLATPRARGNGLAFLLGWVGGLAVVGTVVLLVSSGAEASESGSPADWVNWLKIVLGVLLLGVALKQWRGRPHAGEEAPMPGWMQAIDTFRPPKAAGLAVLLSAVNPKNLLLVVAAAAAIAQTGASGGSQAVALAVFVLIGTVGPGAPVAIYFAMGERSKKLLDELKDWMSHNNAAIMAVFCLVIAAKLIGDGIAGFSA
jgi:threonine/homoserine/homoserine lactone efflux protein